MSQDREEKIRQRAHRIWEEEGRPDGKESEHWQRAAQEVGDDGVQREPMREASESSRAVQDLQSGGQKGRR
jgi:hypothetical protein